MILSRVKHWDRSNGFYGVLGSYAIRSEYEPYGNCGSAPKVDSQFLKSSLGLIEDEGTIPDVVESADRIKGICVHTLLEKWSSD
jgi:hypothetical protein